MKSLVIFDNDGTLVDTEEYMWLKAYKIAFKHIGLDETSELFTRFAGKTKKDNRKLLLEYYDEEIVNEFWDIVNSEIENHIKTQKIIVMPGVVNLLEHLRKKNITCAVASSSTMNEINGMLENAGLLKYFDKIFSGENLEIGKPDPTIYQNVIDYYKIDKKDAIIIEDSHSGSQAAIRANIDLVIVPNRSKLFDEDYNKAVKVYKQIDEAIELF